MPRLNHLSISIAPTAFGLCVALIGIGMSVALDFSSPLFAQEVVTSDDSSSAPRFGPASKIVWEFGLRITATGNATGITATVPIPMDWPEQQLIAATEQKSSNVRDLKITNPTDESRQIVFTVNRLAAGETAEAIMRFEIAKQMIVAPLETGKLKAPSPVPSKLKTFLKPSPQIESKHKRIREIAAELADESLSDWDQVEVIYRWVRDNIEYKFDTEIHSCLEALDDKQGDCEELSSLFIAICRALDIPARAVWIPGHTYPEFYLTDESGNGAWFPCQAAGQYEFGGMTELKPVLQKGDRFRLAGKSGFVRYLQPSLLAKDAAGEIKIEWISRDVTPEFK